MNGLTILEIKTMQILMTEDENAWYVVPAILDRSTGKVVYFVPKSCEPELVRAGISYKVVEVMVGSDEGLNS